MDFVNESDSNVTDLKKTLDCTQTLRRNVIGFVRKISSCSNSTDVVSEEDPENRENYKQEVETCIRNMVESFRELEEIVLCMTSSCVVSSLGRIWCLSQEVASDLTPLYSQLSDTYKWTNKANYMKRISMKAGTSSSSEEGEELPNPEPRIPEAECINNAITKICQSYEDMEISVTRPVGSNAVLSITLGCILKAIVIMKGWLIEWVVIRANNEDMTSDDRSLDLWSESRHQVFQKVTENANAAMIHFYDLNSTELSVKNFLVWLHSYITLFSKRCKKCSRHLGVNMLPPTWRDFQDFESYHEECKPE